MPPTFRVESLLSARLFLEPQIVGDRLYFLSDLSGRLSLYAMDPSGSVPVPLLPPHIALQNPHLMLGFSYRPLPELGRILVMIDRNGDENYQPMFIPLEGGFPEPAWDTDFTGQCVYCMKCDPETQRALFSIDPRTERLHRTIRVDLATGHVEQLGASAYSNAPVAVSPSGRRVILSDEYTFGDSVLFLWQEADELERQLLYGRPIEDRGDDVVPPNGLAQCVFLDEDTLLVVNAEWDDHYAIGRLDLASSGPRQLSPVPVEGLKHDGVGELAALSHLTGDRFSLEYNIDGVSWVYEARYETDHNRLAVSRVVCGEGLLGLGVAESIDYDKASDRYALSFSTATSPAQLFVIGQSAEQVTQEHILGLPLEALSSGEDASFTSHDGLRISARLYTPSEHTEIEAPFPVVIYVHGGPQSQERPDFTWFSMPLIQYFTLNGFAVFVPNTRGSTGYGLDYMKRVDRDWGGQDRLDHVAAIETLRLDPRLDVDRLGVMGRSYGGYMTLTLVGRHPELFKAGCDMFGPYNLLTFGERIPEAWKVYFELSLGHPEHDRDFLVERSPSTWLDQLSCPLLVIQGQNDPRVVERESRDLVEHLRAQGKDIEYLVFEDEGHDVIKLPNKVRCYETIVAFFKDRL